MFIQLEYSGAISVIQYGSMAQGVKSAVTRALRALGYADKHYQKKFAAQATPGTGRRWTLGNTMRR